MQKLKQCKYQCLLLINVLAVPLLGPYFNRCHLRRLWLWVPSTAESSGAKWRGQKQHHWFKKQPWGTMQWCTVTWMVLLSRVCLTLFSIVLGLGTERAGCEEHPATSSLSGETTQHWVRERLPSCLYPGSQAKLSHGGEYLFLCVKHLLIFYTFVINISAVTVCFLFHFCLLAIIVISTHSWHFLCLNYASPDGTPTHSVSLCPCSLTRRAGRRDVAYLEYNFQLVLNHHSYEDKSETREVDIT